MRRPILQSRAIRHADYSVDLSCTIIAPVGAGRGLVRGWPGCAEQARLEETMPPDHAALARDLIPAVLAAGACLLRWRAEGVAAEQKGDGSPVSRADREAEAIIEAALARVAPHLPIIAEEAVSAGRIPAFGSAAFLVDALDGTREYLHGGDDFTVNIALVEDSAPVFGLVLAPASGRLFVTTGAGRAAQAVVPPGRLAEALQPVLSPIATAAPDPRALRVLSSRSHRSRETEAFLARFQIASDTRIGSSVKFGLIAAGEADLYPRFGPTSAWDIAAGHAVLAAAGGSVKDLQGQGLRYGKPGFDNPHFVAAGE
jgi:3'(2'),5'-bisphosphate nucleotidase